MSEATLIPASTHQISFEFMPDRPGWDVSCSGDGEHGCVHAPDPCPIAIAVSEGLRAGWAAASSRATSPAPTPVSVTFGPGSIQIELPEREVHVTAPVTVQMPDRPPATMEVVRDAEGRMALVRPLEDS